MDSFENKPSVIILAAGRSKRMNDPKPFLIFDEKRSFIEKIIDEYLQFGTWQIIVVINDLFDQDKWSKIGQKYGGKLAFIVNDLLDLGRFYSIKLGIENIGDCSYCFIQDTDSPFVNQKVLCSIYESRIRKGYVSPIYKGMGGHPVLIGKDIIEKIGSIKQNDANLREVLEPFPCEKVEMNDRNILININTPVEYKEHFG